MRQTTFDPFGEPVPWVDPSIPPPRPSKWPRSAGIGLFWGLVGLIVLTRAFCFEPGDLSFERTVAGLQNFFALL
jgi:hypothetical protein